MIDMIPRMDKHYLVVSLQKEAKVSPKKTPPKREVKKAIEELSEGMRRVNPPPTSTTCSMWATLTHRQRGRKKVKGDSSSQVLGIIVVFMTITQRIERVE